LISVPAQCIGEICETKRTRLDRLSFIGRSMADKTAAANSRYAVLALFLTLSACQGPGGSRFRSEWPQIVERARARVLAELPNLDNTSREMVLTCDPKLRAVTFPFGGDYTFVWTISSNRTVELDADSDYRKVD